MKYRLLTLLTALVLPCAHADDAIDGSSWHDVKVHFGEIDGGKTSPHTQQNIKGSIVQLEAFGEGKTEQYLVAQKKVGCQHTRNRGKQQGQYGPHREVQRKHFHCKYDGSNGRLKNRGYGPGRGTGHQ